MSCLTSEEKTRLQTRLTRKETQLEAIYDAIDKNQLYVESAMLDTGEASQRMKYRSAEDMYKAAKSLEREIDRLYNLIEGTGIVTGRLRRKNNG